MIVLLAGLVLAACVSPVFAAVNAVEDTTWNTWSSTEYYFAKLSGPSSPSYSTLTIHVTAVDEYELYINGHRIDDGTYGAKDSLYTTVDTFNYSVGVAGAAEKTLYVAAKVINHGLGHGNGIMVDIDANRTDWLGTTILKRRLEDIDALNGTIVETSLKQYPVMWYCCDDSSFKKIFTSARLATYTTGSNWYHPKAELFDKTTPYDVGLKPVMLGSIPDMKYVPNSHVEVIAGYREDVDGGNARGGGLRLRRIDGENLALNKPAEDGNVTDGNLDSGHLYNVTAVNMTMRVDLEREYRLNKMVLYSYGNELKNLKKYCVYAYDAQISRDKNGSITVGNIIGIGVNNANSGGYNYAEVSFRPQIARYAWYRITQDDPSRSGSTITTWVGEMMVFGTGYAPDGTYVSPWFDAGSSNLKNFQRVEWTGDLPAGTSIEIRTQTADKDDVASLWSAAHTEQSFDVDSPEPASKIRYMVRLASQDPDATPTLTSIKLSYSKTNQPLQWGRGRISPASVPMDVDTTLTYTASYKLGAGRHINALNISVPAYSTVSSISLMKVAASGAAATTVRDMVENTDYTAATTSDSLKISFLAPITDNGGYEDQLVVKFGTKLLKGFHNFAASVTDSTNNDGAGPMLLWEDAAGWKATASTIEEDMILDVAARPKVFSPNGDGRNDYAVIGFTLAKVSAPVKITIFSTNGRRVKKICDRSLNPSDFTQYKADAPGRWDGKNDDGDLVPPGIYIYQIVVDTDGGNVVKTGTVVVAY